MQLQPNITFDNHYTLIRQLGRGGFSEVWLAHDSYMDLDVALKIYAPGQGMDEHSIDELRREIKVVFTLNHPNLLTPKYLGVWDGMPYLVLAYCSRGSLTQQIGKLPEQELWHVLHDVAAGLAYLHKNDIVHQDIKPDNILIDDSGNYVITDFGISAKARSTLRKSVIGGAVSGGTTAYMGPERFSRQPAPTKASDIWSFGAMVYEVLEGNVPFGEVGGGMQKGGAEVPYITANVSDALKYTVYKMLSKETWNRPTAETLVAWSQNSQSIDIDYGMLTSDNRSVDSNRPTQLFSHDSTTGNVHSGGIEQSASVTQPSLPKSKTKKHSLLWVVAVLFVLFAGLFIWQPWEKNVSFPQGAIKGVFSVSKSKKVAFSKGNLQYQASTNTWRFAEHQYDYVGNANSNISPTSSGWIDLFGWGTSGWNSGAKAYQPYSTSTTSADYYPGNSATTNLTGTYANADWGVYNAISNGGNQKGLWHTLTDDESSYLFFSRTNSNKLWSFATVNGISGVVLLPDSWSLPSGVTFTAASTDFGTNVYTVAQWTKMENAGAVFLPAAGYRYGTSMNGVGTYGYYWSSTYRSSDIAYDVGFGSGTLYPSLSSYFRNFGRSVRLCAEISSK